MLKYFLVLTIFFSISFPFPYDSHIGDEPKTEADYMEYPVITGYSDTPKEGRVRVSFSTSPKKFVAYLYDVNGEEFVLDNDDRFYAYPGFANYINLDYYGYKRSGVNLKITNDKIYYKPSDSETDFSIEYLSVYFIWGDKFTFPVQNIKSEIGYSDSLGILTTHAMDYKLNDNQMFSNKVIAMKKEEPGIYTIVTSGFSSKFIHNFSNNLAMSIMYRYYNQDITLNDITTTIALNSIELAGGLQLVEMNYGYYDFNFKLIPSLMIPISGKSYFKEEILSLNFVFDFI